MQGDQIKALRIVSRAKGWNPDQYIAEDVTPVDINRRAGAWNPGQNPEDNSKLSESTPFQVGIGGELPKSTATKNANPIPNKPGAGG